MFRKLWRKKAIIVFVFALLILFPGASVRPAQALSKTILFAVGIEKTAEGYTVSGTAGVFKFSNTGETKNQTASGDGATIAEAFDKITTNQGRKVSLAHCNLIVLGESLTGENVAEVLDYFLKKFEVSNNALLVWTDGEIQEILEINAKSTTGAAGGLLETIAAHNQKDLFNMPMTLDRFCKNYAKGREGFMSFITLKDDEINNTSLKAVFKDGIFVRTE